MLFLIQAYNGDDYNGARIVSRAYELRDAVSLSIHCIAFRSLGASCMLYSHSFSFSPSGPRDAITDGPCTACIL